MMSVKVSVLIPVYNTSETLARALDSVIYQTMKEIEIICVDDGSDEATKEVLREYVGKDERIKAIFLDENRGTFFVRKKLIEAATGEYIMFLDSDDEFYPQACAKAYRAAKKTDADVVSFRAEVVRCGDVEDCEYAAMRKFLRCRRGRLRGRKIFETFLTFGGKNVGFSLWNKIYRRPLLVCAAQYIPEERCVLAEDFALTFMVMYQAQRYCGIKEKLIRYYFGTGVSAPRLGGLSRFENFVRREVACKAVRRFLEESEAEKTSVYRKCFFDWREDFLKGNVWQFMLECPKRYSAQVFDMLVGEYGVRDVLIAVLKMFGTGQTARLARKVKGASCLQAQERPVRTIGIFYFRLFNGGVERVISILIPLFMQWGYKVVLLLEEEGENEYPLPTGCEKVILPPSLYRGAEEYALHVAKLCETVKAYGIDALLYQAASSDHLLYDIIAVKSLGIRVFVSLHEVFMYVLTWSAPMFSARAATFLLADGVQSLSGSDAEFMRAYGIRARYIPNPHTFPVADEISLQSANIVWVGRFDEEVKHTRDALEIMKEVVRKIPRAHMLMVGTSGNKAEDESYRRFAAELGIGKNVTFCGFRKDPSDFYRASSVLLLTSSIESWCMVLAEGMSLGLPVVAYDVPHLELMRGNEGCIRVEQRDIRGAAESIVALLQDEKLRSEKAERALETARRFAEKDLRGEWQKMLCGENTCGRDEDMRIALETLFSFYDQPASLAERPSIVRIGLLYLREHGLRATFSRVKSFVRKHGMKETLRRIFRKP